MQRIVPPLWCGLPPVPLGRQVRSQTKLPDAGGVPSSGQPRFRKPIKAQKRLGCQAYFSTPQRGDRTAGSCVQKSARQLPIPLLRRLDMSEDVR
jgi:hypothetical protein